MRWSQAIRSRVAVWLCVALLISLLPSPLLTQEKSAIGRGSLRISVSRCSDATEGAIPGLADLLERSLWKTLADQPAVEVVGPGSSAAAERVLSARITTVAASKKRNRPTNVQVVAETTEPATGRVVYRTTVQGGGFIRPGEAPTAQIERAIYEAAREIATRVVRAERLRGSVTTVDRGISGTIDRGATDGVITGTELEIVRGTTLIGKIRIDRADQTTATGRLLDVQAGAQVQPGDQVRIALEPVPLVQAPPRQPVKGHRKSPGMQWVWIAAGSLVTGGLVALLTGGGGRETSGRRVSVVAADRRIPADGTTTTTITVTIRNAKGNPAPDKTPVGFRTNLGLISPAKALLSTGVATATLTAATIPGTARVRAESRGVSGSVNVEFIPTSRSNVAAHLALVASQQQIPADGTSQTTITALVSDVHNNAVPDGTLVTFTTGLGLVFPDTVQTYHGSAAATLRSTLDAGTATVKVKVGRLVEKVRVEFVPIGSGNRRTLTITASPSSILADGKSTATITATAKTVTGNPVPNGTVIGFTTSGGTVFPATTTTTNGVATATLRSDLAPGRARITATLGPLQAKTFVAMVSRGGEVATVFLTRDPAEIAGDGTSTSSITATVRDASNSPVQDGTLVVFSTTRGLISPHAVTTTNGSAATTLRSEPTSVDLTATVTGEAGHQQAVTTVKFTGTGSGPSRISLIADRTNLPADGKATARLRVTVTKSNGTPAADKTVTFTTTAGLLRVVGQKGWQPSVSTTTDSQGSAEVLLRSTTTPDTATVTASAPSVTSDDASVVITFSSFVITSVTADPASVAVGGNSSSRVTANVVDTVGNPAPDGTVVEFSIVNQAQLPSATITRSAATSQGKAVAVFRSGAEVGTARIRAAIPSANASNDQTIIGITAGPPAFVAATADKFVTSARAIGQEGAVTITALVSDQYSNPVSDGTAVRFSVTPAGGAVITGTATTSGGFATATMYPTGFIGDVTAIASTTGADGQPVDNSDRPVVVHMAGPPVSVAIISPDPSSYSPANPLQLYTQANQGLTIQLKDSANGPADPNAEVTFQADRGYVTPDPAPITAPLAGTATATFRSDQPTPTGTVDKIVAISEGVSSAPLYIFISVNPATP